MKTLKKYIWQSLMLFAIIMAIPNKSHAQGEAISFQTFYDELSPYGTWIDDPNYGNVWVPDAGPNFRPYASDGHWVLTDYGNTWVSDYDWGWAPFHYGRWRFDDYYGWEWVPGYEWGPAWVNWRSGGGYYGWAPLNPGLSVSVSFGSGYDVPESYWVFAAAAYINSPRIYNYYVPRARVNTYIRQTNYITNVYVNDNRRYYAGPRREDIQRYTHTAPPVYHINNAERPGRPGIYNHAVNIYRPSVTHVTTARPTRVVDANAYRNAHPAANIGNHNTGNINHNNAAQLAAIARSNDAANRNMVRVNNRPNLPNQPGGNRPQPNQPGQQGRPYTPNQHGQPNQQGQPAQPNNPNQHGQERHPQMGQLGSNQPNSRPTGDVQQQGQPQQQQAQQQRQQQQAQQQAQRQQREQQMQQQQGQQRQQQQAQQQREQQAQRQQQMQQRRQQQAQQQAQQQQREQQAQQQAQRQQQMQQRQQQQAQQQAQQQQREQQAQQQAQRQQQMQQRQQQQREQQAQRQQQMQQRQQQQAQQQAQRQQQQMQQQQRQQQQQRPQRPPQQQQQEEHHQR